MGSPHYTVRRSDEEILVARALLPQEIDEGIRLI